MLLVRLERAREEERVLQAVPRDAGQLAHKRPRTPARAHGELGVERALSGLGVVHADGRRRACRDNILVATHGRQQTAGLELDLVIGGPVVAALDRPAGEEALEPGLVGLDLERSALALLGRPSVAGPHGFLEEPGHGLQVRRSQVDSSPRELLGHLFHDLGAEAELARDGGRVGVPLPGDTLLGNRRYARETRAADAVRETPKESRGPDIDRRHVRLADQVQGEVARLRGGAGLDVPPQVGDCHHGAPGVHAIELAADLADLLLGRELGDVLAFRDPLLERDHLLLELAARESLDDVDGKAPVDVDRRVRRGRAQEVGIEVAGGTEFLAQSRGHGAIPRRMGDDRPRDSVTGPCAFVEVDDLLHADLGDPPGPRHVDILWSALCAWRSVELVRDRLVLDDRVVDHGPVAQSLRLAIDTDDLELRPAVGRREARHVLARLILQCADLFLTQPELGALPGDLQCVRPGQHPATGDARAALGADLRALAP